MFNHRTAAGLSCCALLYVFFAQAIVNEDPENASFWGALGGLVEVTAEGDDDEAASKASAAEVKLLHLSDAGGNVSMAEQPRNAKGQLTRDMLSGDDAYVFVYGQSLLSLLLFLVCCLVPCLLLLTFFSSIIFSFSRRRFFFLACHKQHVRFLVLLLMTGSCLYCRYILDCGDSIFVWTGKKASKTEKKESMLIAAQFVADQGRPAHTPVRKTSKTRT